MEQPFVLAPDLSLVINASMGVALSSEGSDAGALVRAADQALYQSKRQKTYRTQCWTLYASEALVAV